MITLFGTPHSLYTGKARAYLRKQGLAYREVLPSDPRFSSLILPAIGRMMIPVILLDDGTIIQDTTDIIDWGRNQGLEAIASLPATPVRKLTALALDLFGTQGLTRAAMHYRWSYRDQQAKFLNHEFGLTLRAAGVQGEALDGQLAKMMAFFHGYLPKLGVNEDTIPAIEASYLDLMASLNAHFERCPYALGSSPTIADYGLVAPLWAHLGRDPVPADLMKRQAPSLFRWAERMQASDPDCPEFPEANMAHAAASEAESDTLPDTLLPVLRLLAQDILPEFQMAVATINAWIAQTPDIEVGTFASAASDGRGFRGGMFDLRGVQVRGAVTGYTLYMIQRVTDAFDALSAHDQALVKAQFTACGLDGLLSLRGLRRVERVNHREVWGEAL
jgi:glutathione S-transferase